MPANFKSDDSFLRKLVVGAEGTKETMTKLRQLGFDPVELERGSTGYKIWKKIKIKRIRVPDILCLKTGLRFESRGKTKPEISMSHSKSRADRVWDYGMCDTDWVSIVVFHQDENNPVDVRALSPVHFISVAKLREAFKNNQVDISTPKGVEEGSEVRVVWTCAAAPKNARVESIDQSKLVLRLDVSQKLKTIKLERKKFTLKPQVKVGDSIGENQIVASVVPTHLEVAIPKAKPKSGFIADLDSCMLSERYAAAKALRFLSYSDAGKRSLKQRAFNDKEDVYVRLEASAALAAHDHHEGWSHIESCLFSENLVVPLDTQLEAVIVLSEIPKVKSEEMLINVLTDSDRHEELRAGAAWGLGQFCSQKSAIALIDTFNQCSTTIKAESARALLQIAKDQVPLLLDLLKQVSHDKRDGISWALAKVGHFDPTDILKSDDVNLRRWASYIFGYGKANFSAENLEEICQADPPVYFAASVLWQVLESWTHNLKEY